MKKLLILFLLLSLTGCSSQVDLGAKKDKKEKPVKVEKLKAKKDKILKVQDVDECVEWRDEEKLECKKTKKVKQYHYISDKKVEKQKINYKGVELEEALSKRTKNSVHFKIPKDEKLLGASEEQGDTYVAKFYSGNPFYEDTSSSNTEWYQTEVATTTVENYETNQVSTSTVIINFIKWLGGYKVLADTDTFYSGAGDGSVSYVWGSFSIARNTAGNNSVSHTSTRARVLAGKYLSNYGVGRNFYPIQTSSLPSDSTISDAELHLFYSRKDGTARTNTYHLVEGKQASYTSIEANDNLLSRMGTVSWGSLTISSWVEDQDNTFTLNSSGIAGINKSGYTSLCLREAGDFNNSAPSYVYFGPYWDTSEQTGTSNDPYLEVVYTTLGVSRRIMLIN